MTDNTKKRGDKMATAIRLINENPTLAESQIGKLIADTLKIKLGNAIHNYYKAPIRKGLCNIKSRVLDVGKNPRKPRQVKKVVAKTAAKVIVESKPTPVVNTKAVVKPVEKPTFTPEQVAEFQADLERIRKDRKPLPVDKNGNVELPAFLRRTA